MRSTFSSRAHFLSSRLVVAFLLAFAMMMTVKAQFGVSPSQMGTFYEELGARAGARMQQGQTQATEGTYDYSEEAGYVGDGTNGGVLKNASRQIAQGYYGTGSGVYSARQAGDYTQYAGPYPSSATFFAPTYTSDPFLGGRRNMKLGPVNVGFGLTGMFEYNDNINRSGSDPVSDMIASAYLNISANYPISEKSSLTLATAIGFDHYFDHPELSPYGNEFVLNVLPGSTIGLDFMVGPVWIEVYDTMAVRPASQNDFTLNANNYFGVFTNDAGIRSVWRMNKQTTVKFVYQHQTATAMDSNDPNQDFSNYDRNMDTLSAAVEWSPNGAVTFGVQGSYNWVEYPNQSHRGYNLELDINRERARILFDKNFKNPAEIAQIGAYFITPIGKETTLRVDAGYQNFDFGGAPDAIVDESHLSDYTYNVTLANRLSARVSQALNFGHETSLNTVSNFITADYVSYGVGIIAWQGSRILLSSYFEESEDSIGVSAKNAGLRSEVLDQWGFDVYLSQQITPRLRVGVGYHYGQSDSNLDGRSYYQQSFNADIAYALTRKLSLAAGYRHVMTEAEDDTLDFDQNRFIFSANYNF